jgi:ATP-dependent protease ClpP protease subunit
MLPPLNSSKQDLFEAIDGFSDNANVLRVGRHIYFYADVDTDTALELTKLLREVDGEVEWDKTAGALKPIILHIQSNGGYLSSALAIADIIESLDTAVVSVIEGWAASASTIISTACDSRKITRNSIMLIHQFSGSFWGTYEQFKDNQKLHEIQIEQLRNFYRDHCKLGKKKITEMLKHDYWMSSKESLEHGFVDEVV